MKAYFAYVNATRTGPDNKRGVFGRQIIWKYYDDEFNPANTRAAHEKARRGGQGLRDGRPARHGADPRRARPYLNQQKVPQPLVSTGASYWGTQGKEYPWTIGWQPDYIAEGRLYGLHIKRTIPGKKIAILYQNDDYGKDYLYGVRYALGPTYARREHRRATRRSRSRRTNLASQMAQDPGERSRGPRDPRHHHADGHGRSRPRRALGYRPEQIYMNSVSAIQPVVDAISRSAPGRPTSTARSRSRTLKDPAGPEVGQRPGDEAVPRDHRRSTARARTRTTRRSCTGWRRRRRSCRRLYKAGKNLTRAKLMNALLNMNATNKFLLPGVKQKTGKKDHFIISQMQLQRQTRTASGCRSAALIEGRPRALGNAHRLSFDE